MIINCPNCNKKFEIDKKLIPTEGRLLQCGSCNNKWFFNPQIIDESTKVAEKTEPEVVIEKNKNLLKNINKDLTNEELKDTNEENDNIDKLDSPDEILEKKVNKKNNINLFKILIVIIISFIALIIILDTFKSQLSLIIPNIEIFLDNLYQSLNDIKLFILDLIK